jgi:hypothetical protein
MTDKEKHKHNKKIQDDLYKAEILNRLSKGHYIKKTDMNKMHHELVSGGYANYTGGWMTKNWKTEYWSPEPAVPYVAPEPIWDRFEILDL